ncbi:MAG: hypothetical protein KGD74_12415 [Candidatus Lokiarchaeota archaeon]|nr:hypothetical protein [Candidatus Lokiarchaeota archaeon]
MVISLSTRSEFLKGFQKKVIQGRKLLQFSNHLWADRLLTDLYFDIEKTEWLDIQKKHQLIMIISNSWWMYINSLIHRTEEGIDIDFIRYVDAYKRFFSFLSKLDDFYLLNNFATNLLKSFTKMDSLSQKGITKFINSFCVKVIEREDYIKLIELQLVLMYLRKSVVPQEFFHLSMEVLGRTIFKLEPGKRALFLYVFIENVNVNFQLMENSEEFVKIMIKILVNRIPGYLKNEFSNMGKISINERNFNTILGDLEGLIYYLNNIGEHSWIIPIIKNLFSKIQAFHSYGDAVTYIRKFIDFAITRNRFEIAFQIYDFLEDLFLYQTDLGYDNILIELWVEACKKFVEMKEKKYLLQSIEKLNTHLKIPQTNAQLYHFFYTCNFLWKFKSLFFSLEQKDFWQMMFYRVVYEQKDFKLAQKIIPYLEKNLINAIGNTLVLYNETESLRREIYSFGKENLLFTGFEEGFVIKKMVFRIDHEGLISIRMISVDDKIVEGKIFNEYWNDAHIIDIYNDIFSDGQEKKYNFSVNEFGRLLYVFLPIKIRTFLEQFEIKSLNITPEIYFILDEMTIPFELIYDNNFFLLKYSIGYIIGEPPLGGVPFGHDTDEKEEKLTRDGNFNVLIIDSINSSGPITWNEEIKSKELIFPFKSGINEFNYIAEFFNNREEVNQITVLMGPDSSRDNILTHIETGSNHIIHFVGNIFYSKWNPRDSFFLSNDNEIITFNDINNSIKANSSAEKPFLFFNSQIYDTDGKKLKNVLRTFGEIVEYFDYERITGVMSRNYPIFNDETKEIIANFYINLFNDFSQGVSLMKARQTCMANKMTKLVEKKFDELSAEEGVKNIDLEGSLAISSYMLFGKPWKKLS